MDYYTIFDLEVLEGFGDASDHKREVSEVSGYPDCFGLWATIWPDYEGSMRAYSKLYPNTLFLLTGEGEDPVDVWHAYYRDGKSHVVQAEIVYPPYDETLLK